MKLYKTAATSLDVEALLLDLLEKHGFTREPPEDKRYYYELSIEVEEILKPFSLKWIEETEGEIQK